MLRVRVDEVWGPILTLCGMFRRKSSTHVHKELPSPRLLSFVTSLCGMMVLKAELKLTNSILTYVLLLSRCESAVCRAVITASSADLFDWYAHCYGSFNV